MFEQIGRAVARADGARLDDDPERLRKLAMAALKSSEPCHSPGRSPGLIAFTALLISSPWV
jgi:hypothetical protein